MINKISKELRKYSSRKKAVLLQRFFKTGPGEYGEGDVFLGVMVPHIRRVSKQYRDLPLSDTVQLLKSKYHEERLLALLILVLQYADGDSRAKEQIYKVYMGNTRYINNWDLIDLTAHHIVGQYLAEKDKKPLFEFTESPSLWKRRISIIATFFYIKQRIFGTSLKIAEKLLHDKEDLIHKAVGWMLREIGKKDLLVEEKFLKKHYKQMPRTMLRYAIEKFPEPKRKAYLNSSI